MREYARIHEICGKLTIYAQENSSLPATNVSRMGVADLAAAGILSREDAAYIKDHDIQFRGFNPARIGAEIPVLETVFTNMRVPRRIVGYSDGHVVSRDPKEAH
jgi:hypothetical protein